MVVFLTEIIGNLFKYKKKKKKNGIIQIAFILHPVFFRQDSDGFIIDLNNEFN